jgi:PAS domain S-box-containing protein
MNSGRSVGPAGLSEDEAFATFTRAGVSMVLTNPHLPDNPIVYVNDAFERTTGFARAAAVGRNCRFLQGERTDPDHVAALREGIAEGREVAVDILNYRADGTPFRNRLLVAPVHGADGRAIYHLGIQKELSAEEARRSGAVPPDEAMREIQHRVKNHLAMIVGLIRIQSRQNLGARDHFDTLARRVESLQLLYEELSFAGPARGGETISLGAYLGRICNAIAHLDGRPGIRVGINMADLAASVETGARIGLILSEVVTNALEHAFVDRQRGELAVRLLPWDGHGVRVEVRDDGVGLPAGVRWPDMESLGGRIVAGLVDGLAARLLVDSGPGGTTVTLDVPDASARG